MDNRRSQHYNFTHETIPIMWHNQTSDFIKYAEKDGATFLRFWWKHLADNLGIKILSDSEGLGVQVRNLVDKNSEPVTAVVISLPTPVAIGEVYYMVLVKLPKKVTFFDLFLTRLPTTRAFALQLEKKNEDGSVGTGLYELTVRARNVRIGDGTEPVLDAFYKQCLSRLHLA